MITVDHIHETEVETFREMREVQAFMKRHPIISDLGADIMDDPAPLLQRIADKSNFVPTGLTDLDEKLFGGMPRGSLNIFAGGSGSGKSMLLQNLAVNWVEAGKHVVYASLELSEDLVQTRALAMATGLGVKEMHNHQGQATLAVRKWQSGVTGSLKVKRFPESTTTANDLRAYLKQYEIQYGRKPDILLVDYLDLMRPNSDRIDLSNAFNKDKFVSEELRALAAEWNLPLVTASQLNRSATAASEHDHSHIAGGISKINTADNVMSIMATTKAMIEGNYREIQFLKTRNSDGVGQRIKFDYAHTSMRLSDFTGAVARLPAALPPGPEPKPLDGPVMDHSARLRGLMERSRREDRV